jgi:hypothetical protein
LIECADRQLVLTLRPGKQGQGIQLRGTRPFTFKTLVGTVSVARTRISHGDGSSQTPAAVAWQTAHRCELTPGLRQVLCDQMLDVSAAAARSDVADRAGEPALVSKSTVLNVVHHEGRTLHAALHQRAHEILDEAAATAPQNAAAAAPGEPPVIVQLDEVKTKAQPQTGRKELWAFTAVVMLAGWCHRLVDRTQEGLFLQLAAVLQRLGVTTGTRPLVVLADGAGWIRAWFSTLAVPSTMMVLCWYHVRKRCYQKISGSGLPKAVKKPLLGQVLGSLWAGRVEEAVQALRRVREQATRPAWIDELIHSLEARWASLPNYQARKEAGLPVASPRVEKWNDWAVSQRCKGHGMSWTPEGLVA